MRQVLCPVLIGRDEEVAWLDEALDAARRGEGRLVVVSGEAGVGKSRLSLEVESHAGAAGMTRLRGRAVATGATVPFRPLTEALVSVLADRDVPEMVGLDPFRGALGRLVPAWAGEEAAPAESGLVVLEGVLRLLSALANETGLLLVLEDLQWADVDTLAVLDYLGDHIRGQPILCLATERSGHPGPAAEVLASLVARRAADRISLERLPEDSVDQMARRCLELGDVPAGILSALRRRAEGLPFLVEEMLSAYVAAGGATGGRIERDISRRLADALPPSYVELVRTRLQELDGDSRKVVTAGAVLGRAFDWRLLIPITELPEPQVIAAMRDAVRSQLLVEGGSAHVTGFSFRHALVRETILAELLPPEWSELSLRAADAIEDRYPGTPGEWCDRAADLREQAGDRLGACRLLQESARRALKRGALATAEASLLRARELAADDPMAWLGADELLVEVLARAGKTERLVEISRGVLSSVEEYMLLSGPRLAGRRFGLELQVARAAILAGDIPLATEHLARASKIQGVGEEPANRASFLSLEAQVSLATARPARAGKQAEAAVQAAEEAGLAEIRCQALDTKARAALHGGGLEQAVETFGELTEVSSRENLDLWRMQGLLELGAFDVLRGGSTERLELARDIARRVGAVSALARIDLELAHRALGFLELDEARAAVDRCIDASRHFHLRLLPDAFVAETMLLALGGDLNAMAASKQRAVEAGMGDPLVESRAIGNGAALVAILAERRSNALTELERAAALAGLGVDSRACWFLGLRILVLAVEGMPTEELPPSATADPSNRAYVAYADAVRRGEAGDAEEAEAAFDRGDAWMPPGWRRNHARRLVSEAAVRDGWGDPASWAAESLAAFERAGITPIADACRAILRRAGVSLPRRGRGDSEVPADLQPLGVTSREMDVLHLVGEGLSNTEIGERLFISPRTVETHVASLVRKTGVENRVRLVAFAGEHRVAPDSGSPVA